MAFLRVKCVNYYVKHKNKTSRQLFRNLNIDIKQDDFITLVGGNGSGKTTLTKLLIGMLEPDEGIVLLEGKDIHEYKRYEIGQRIGYLFQNPELQLFNATIAEELFFAYEFGDGVSEGVQKRYDEVIELLSLQKALRTPVKRLSHGEKQRLAIGTVLMNNPKFLILDEPTVGLDTVRKQALKEILVSLNDKGIGIFIVSHDDEFIRSLPTVIYKICERRVMCE